MPDLTFTIDENFRRKLRENALPQPPAQWTLEGAGLDAAGLLQLFESQVLSRQLDLLSRRLQPQKKTFYTIGSSGHEGNAAIAKALRVTDPAFLHYRDAAFYIQRARAVPSQNPERDLLLSFAASADDPIAGGRHKVLGSKALNIPPQTSTIASQLPKAVGVAYSFAINQRLGVKGDWPADSIAVCSFGDASVNHSTAQGAFNTASWTAHQGLPMPLLWICEDNGLGVSVPTPRDWIQASMSQRPDLHYIACDGLDLLDTYKAARDAADIARRRRRPVFLHMRCVRLMGHAGSDAEQGYLTPAQIAANEAQDPLLHSAALLLRHRVLTAGQILERYDAIGRKLPPLAEEACARPKLRTPKEIMASIVPPKRASRAKPWQGKPDPAPQTMARLINAVLDRTLERYPHAVMAGEDIGKKGGVYGVTLKLQQKHGPLRVMDTLLDEQSILGLAIGFAHNGLLPIVEIQYLAYLHNAEDQIRGEASTLSFFSKGQYTNPMVVRMAGLAYQKGFGGHFHNDNAIAVLRDIPGILVACPSNAADAVGLLQECVRLADEEQRVVVFLEPIALYHTRDLEKEGDGQWSFADPGASHRIRLGELGRFGKGKGLAIVTYGNGYYLSRQALPAIERAGIAARVIDLRWLTGISHDAVHEAVKDCEHVLVVDECRRSGSVSEELITALVERQYPSERMARLTAEDSFIPLGVAATATLPSRESIVAAATALAGGPSKSSRKKAV